VPSDRKYFRPIFRYRRPRKRRLRRLFSALFRQTFNIHSLDAHQRNENRLRCLEKRLQMTHIYIYICINEIARDEIAPANEKHARDPLLLAGSVSINLRERDRALLASDRRRLEVGKLNETPFPLIGITKLKCFPRGAGFLLPLFASRLARGRRQVNGPDYRAEKKARARHGQSREPEE